MGSFDGAETCELVGLYLLSQLQYLDIKVGLYRDDGQQITSTDMKNKEKMCAIFRDNGLNITIQDATIPYTEALKKNGHVKALKYAGKKTNTTTKNENKRKETANEETKETNRTNRRKRRITWLNPPYSKNVSSNIGKKIFDLLNSCFPANHKLHKIINKNTTKLSYSCTTNIKQIISSHNKRIINESSKKVSTTNLCNCRDKPSCPLQGNSLEQSLVYQATVKETNTNKIDTYIGITENTFKTRFNQHNYVKL
ncbi:hypothetical protein ElyMa_005802200 [Elysia marginata]|uniref:GIY-YIG domain-containing protein n=1 Tax=Elysia marginata TaxID=1093978 RepID=A0AAV4FTX6_9GAST|nr:hypothetical protein ElyMa_005802200 [Elysia marginata]